MHKAQGLRRLSGALRFRFHGRWYPHRKSVEGALVLVTAGMMNTKTILHISAYLSQGM